MKPAPAVEFREVMRGPFARGAADALAGAREGLRAGTVLTLAAEAAIADVPAFVRDPGHAGRLSGSVTFPGVGADRADCRGAFQLFVPAPGHGLKLMVYRVAFRVGGTEYFLDGEKQVGRRSLLAAWSETTTLHCRLHEGTDARGPVVAAGVLHLGAFAFARQLLSFRTPGAGGPFATVSALAAFLRFFSGELIDTYVRGRR